MKKKILFRSDGNSTIGFGHLFHLFRLFSLVEIIKNNFNFIFLTKESTSREVFPKDYPITFIPSIIKTEDEPGWIASHYSKDDYIIIADGYQFNSVYQKLIKDKGFQLIYIDDFAKEHMFADIVVNHSPFVKKEDYQKEKHTQLALGTNYSLLRPLFLKAAKEERLIEKIDIAFVCFGGADPFHLSLKAVKALLEIKEIKKIHVVLGGDYYSHEITKLGALHNGKIITYQNLTEKELINVMQLCNLGIVSSSTILYELCCVKMPILSGFFVDNQELIYKGFLNKSAIYGAGDIKNFKVSDFKEQIKTILINNNYNSLIASQKLLFDNAIKTRQLDLIKSLC
jgi:UDP-2,4-diacetamido-2,4,6-trideoxy-beta-L-altropyranose hydrolase